MKTNFMITRSRLSSTGIPIALLLASFLGGCAPLPPMPFALIDKAQTYRGTLSQSDRRVEVTIGGKHFQGYYLLATGTAYFDRWSWRRPFPSELSTTFISNSARATMVAPDGERFACDFIIEDNSAIGECRSSGGATYQLITNER